MRNIQYIVLHCTATQPEATLESITRYWQEVRGWAAPGYHRLVTSEGQVHELLPYDQVSNGVYALNDRVINLCYMGGIDRAGNPHDTRTGPQQAATLRLIHEVLALHPAARVAAHYQFAAKACPSFDVPKWLRQMSLAEANIFDNGKASPVQ